MLLAADWNRNASWSACVLRNGFLDSYTNIFESETKILYCTYFFLEIKLHEVHGRLALVVCVD